MTEATTPGATKRDRTTERILDAATQLFADSGPSEISVRDVAARAGVSHALVHRYFGSKDELVAATMERMAQRLKGAIEPADSAERLLVNAFDVMLDDPTIPLMVIRNLAGRGRIESYPFPLASPILVRMISEGHALENKPSPGAFDPRVIVACLAAVAIGWAALEESLVTAGGMGAQDLEQARAEVRRLFAHVLALAEAPSTPPSATGA